MVDGAEGDADDVINFVVGLTRTRAIATFGTEQEEHGSLVGLAAMASSVSGFFQGFSLGGGQFDAIAFCRHPARDGCLGETSLPVKRL